MPDLNDMATFARVVEAGSFSRAAQRMAASKSRVSKAVMRLERALGARLLNRSTRSLSLTEAGEAYFAHCRRMLDEARLAQQAVSRHHALPLGVVKLAAPVAFGAQALAGALPEFLQRHPQLEVELMLTDQAPDFFAGGLDLALLAGQQPAPGLAARRIARLPQVLCASPEYLRSHAAPQAGDLAPQRLRTQQELALWQAVRAGLGMAVLPLYLAQADLASGRLVAVLPAGAPQPVELLAVRLPGVHVAPKVRVLIDFLCERFSARSAAGRSPVERMNASPGLSASASLATTAD
jgi:DNA-binding transcriptional LysR family regulator